MSRVKKKAIDNNKRLPPVLTQEGREAQLVAMAYDLAEKQLREGTASSQVITQILKLGTTRERLERDILREQKKLVTAKTSAIESQKKFEDMYDDMMRALRTYKGEHVEE